MSELRGGFADVATLPLEAPPLSALRRRTRRRRARLAGACVAAVTLVGGGWAAVSDRAASRTVVAEDPAARHALGREAPLVPLTDAERDALAARAQSATITAVGRVDGTRVTVGTYVDDGGATCLVVVADSVHTSCGVVGAPGPPITSAADDHVVWANVPADAVVVRLRAGSHQRWQRTTGPIAALPGTGSPRWWRAMHIEALDADGRVLASETWRRGRIELVHRDAQGRVVTSVRRASGS